MYQSETMDAVRDAAETLTREGKVLTTGNPEFPLAVFADTYKVDDEPTNTALPEEEIVAIEEHFDAINQDSTPAEDDTRESIVANLHTAVAKVQFNTTNIIIPSIKAMHAQYAGMQASSSEPEYAVRAWRYLAPHNSATLVNHINTRYTQVQPKDSYRSFHLESQTADAIVEMMAVNNPHLEQEEVTEWALQVGTERLEAVWSSLFASNGVVVPAGLPYLTAQGAPFNVDDILVAYFLCGHYIDNPVSGTGVDIDEWEHTLKILHEMFGFYLTRAYTRRADAREQGQMILTNDAVNPIDTRRAVVICNGDVFDPWVLAGGDIQAVLGAAVENSGVTDVRHLDANAQKFIARWHAVYPMIKQAAIDFSDRQRVNNVIDAFREVGKSELLKERYTQETEAKLIEALRYIRRDDYENPYKVFSSLICRVYFPEATYLEYLDAIDQYGQDFPKATVRELATQAMISLVAIFQAKQIVTELFMPEINPDGPEEPGQFNDSGLLAMAGDEGDGGEEAETTDMTGDGGELDGVDGLDGVEGDVGPSDTGLGEGTDEFGGDASVDDIVSEDADVGDTESDIGGDDAGTDVEDAEDDDAFTEEEEEDPYADLETPDEGEEVETEESEESESTDGEFTADDSAEATEEVEQAEETAETEEAESETEEEETDESEEDEEEDETPLT